MSFGKRIVLPVLVSSLAILAGCGGSGSGTPTPTPPPSGGFSKSNLNGTYVFSASGVDQSGGNPYAVVGTFSANGNGSITGGAIDMIDAAFSGPATNIALSGNNIYSVGVDGRGQLKFSVSTPFGTGLTIDFVLQDSSHGLVIQFDGNATGSGSHSYRYLCFYSLGRVCKFKHDGAVRSSGKFHPWIQRRIRRR